MLPDIPQSAILGVLALLVPGSISYFTYCLFVPSNRISDQLKILQIICLSVFNAIICAYIILCLRYVLSFNPITVLIASTFYLIVLPCVWGLIMARLAIVGLPEWMRRVLSFVFGVQALSFNATGWEYKLSRVKDYAFLIVSLEDGNLVRGLFGPNSLASSEMDHRDLYLEQVYIETENGWVADPGLGGMWIKETAIKAITFVAQQTQGGVSNDG